MSVKEYKDLHNKYLHYFSDDSEKKITCNTGWYKIINDMLAAIDLYYTKLKPDDDIEPVFISKIEEKFGCLNVDYEGGDEIVEAMMFYTRTMSFFLCEYCGEPGELHCSSKHARWSYVKTLCIKHAIEKKYYGMKK